MAPAYAGHSTYRIQWQEGFGFAELARDVVPYLARLGIRTLYIPPPFEAAALHSYNMLDPTRLSEVLGGETGFAQLVQSLRAHCMHLLLDFPPNHLCASTRNPWWREVLEQGEQAEYAKFFDITWSAHPQRKLVLPVLGEPLEHVLGDASKVRLALTKLGCDISLAGGEPLPLHWQSIAPTLQATAAPPQTWQRYNRDAVFRQQTDASLQALVQNPPALRELIAAQHYVPTCWKGAEINYRRFFDVNELVGVCVEDPVVRAATHQKLFALIETYPDVITGLRIDHIDGLRDPKSYLEWLAEKNLYVICEKILAEDEMLVPTWPIAGTTGYDYLARANNVFVDPKGMATLEKLYRRVTGDDHLDLGALKCTVLGETFATEVRRLADDLLALAEQLGIQEGVEITALRRVVSAVIAGLSHYRTYVDAEGYPSDADREVARAALTTAKHSIPWSPSFALVERVLLLESESTAERTAFIAFVQTLQMYTGAVMAKSLEDTAMYRFNRLIAQNEVGGGLLLPGDAVAEFHQHNTHNAFCWPRTMTTISTHDTKRSADVRSRVHVLSELPQVWDEALRLWDAPYEQCVVDPNDRYLLYQTMLGVYAGENTPEELLARLQTYMLKAIREAKVHTSWTAPQDAYEQAVLAWVSHFTTRVWTAGPTADSFMALHKRVARLGAHEGLAQLLCQATAPGIPDFYAGSELWQFSLVDPDNRRPVDWQGQRKMLDALQSLDPDTCRALLSDVQNPLAKMFVTRTALEFRARHQAVLEGRDYRSLQADGPQAQRVLAFARGQGARTTVTVVGRLLAPKLGQSATGLVWRNTTLQLPRDAFPTLRNALTGDSVRTVRDNQGRRCLPLDQVFATAPLALLEPTEYALDARAPSLGN